MGPGPVRRKPGRIEELELLKQIGITAAMARESYESAIMTIALGKEIIRAWNIIQKASYKGEDISSQLIGIPLK